MILSNTSIQQALDEGRLQIEPEPLPRNPTLGESSPYGRSAVDLTLGSRLRVPRSGLAIGVDPGGGDTLATLNALYALQEIPAEGFVLEPHRLVLGVTHERVKLPLPHEIAEGVRENGWLAARVEGKSSLARFGLLVHFTAPTIHAGFEGHITLEIMNLGPSPIILRRGMAICQLILELVHGVPAGPPSRFAGQADPSGST
ncbi:MAG: dCTP deaminase [Chloroflexi bacterium]|nr:dCTP deaminase [Chloroflexota bacterium]MYD66676.1 dCTP deaminase [Chloroflexota bacterium]